jgi:hypothetical protein
VTGLEALMTTQETIIRWSEDEADVVIYSTSPDVWRRCERLGIPRTAPPSEGEGAPEARWYRMPKGRLRWGVRWRLTERRRVPIELGPVPWGREGP